MIAAIVIDDLDTALSLGLLDSEPCPQCTPACRTRLLAVRQDRRAALSARERYRQRNARLQRRAEQRASRRAMHAAPAAHATTPSALPSAAAAALVRARAKAAQRHKP